ncbi:MAG: hypothetical protein Q9195_000295 [Heterodermia aff. obscurata]
MSESLEDRLKGHAEAFNGLLSLIPAKHYYGGDTSDQWHKKKQTKEEARNAKLAKLDPDNVKSAKDVMDENARKRKREMEDGSDLEGIEIEKPLEGFKRATKKSKKQQKENTSSKKSAAEKAKTEDHASHALTSQKAKAEKRRSKLEQKKAKVDVKNAKNEAKKARKEESRKSKLTGDGWSSSDEDNTNPIGGAMSQVELEDVDQVLGGDQSPTATPSPRMESPAFDAPPAQSGSSSISSIAPPNVSEESELRESIKESVKDSAAESEPKQPKISPEELRVRLETRINALRAARKADGLNGQPARSRQELMEARRLKENERKAHKKELRRQAKEDEDRKRAESIARGSPLISGSPLYSPLTGSNAINSPTESNNNFSFGRVVFGDGQQASAQLNDILNIRASKGPSDPATALQAAEKRQARLASLDDGKRTDINEKDAWLNAKKHAHGERIRDDTSLLKKTLKRKEKQKEKSKKEWTERLEGIKKAQGMKQKRREENLQKRKDEKGGKGKKGKGKPKQKPRPGFEGSFRARASSGGTKKK